MDWMKYLVNAALVVVTAGVVSILSVRPNASTITQAETAHSDATKNGPSVYYVVREAPQTAAGSGEEVAPTPTALASTTEKAFVPLHTDDNVVTEFEVGFAKDGPATKDTRQAETLLRSSFADPALRGVRLRQAECRTTLCRAEILFEDAEADRTAFAQVMGVDSPLTQEMGQMGAVVPERKIQPDGSIVATLYLYAPGSDPARALEQRSR